MGHKMTPYQRKWQLDRLRRWMNTDEAALGMIDVDTEAGPPGAGDPGEAGVIDDSDNKLLGVCWSTWTGHSITFMKTVDGIAGYLNNIPLRDMVEQKRISERQMNWLLKQGGDTINAIESDTPVDPNTTQLTLMRIN